MAHRMIGVEIGSSTLKMAVFAGGTIRQMAVEKMPEDLVREGRPTSAAAMADFLKRMMKRCGIRGGACALVLPRQVVIGHRVTMPLMRESELRLNLPFEFRDFVDMEGTQYDYDYAVMGIQGSEMVLYAAAAPRDAVEEYCAIFKRAGLTLKIATPPEMAWSNLIHRGTHLPRKLCIVDAGHKATRVNIFADGNFIMGKDIEIAGAHFDRVISEVQNVDIYAAQTRKEANMDQALSGELLGDACQALAIEVMKVVNFYSYTHNSPGGSLEHLYYCGGSSLMEPLRSALHRTTGLTPHPIHRLMGMDDASGNTALYCALATGAAVQK